MISQLKDTFIHLSLGVEGGSLIARRYHDHQSFYRPKKQSLLDLIIHRIKKMDSYSASDRQDVKSIAITKLGLLSLLLALAVHLINVFNYIQMDSRNQVL